MDTPTDTQDNPVKPEETQQAVEPPKRKLIKGAPWTMVTGPKGSGKSRLAGTKTDAFCFDTEPPGAATAFPDEYRMAFQFGIDMYDNLLRAVERFKTSTVLGERCRVMQNGQHVGALVIDTFDTLQRVLINKYLSQKPKPGWAANKIWAPTMEQRDWGTLLNYQTGLVTMLKEIGLPVIWVAHNKVSDPVYDGYGDRMTLVKKGYRGLDISGSIEGFIINLCDYTLHITVGQDGQRIVYTQPTVVEDYQILAGDRHNLFKNSEHDWTSFQLKAENGYPRSRVMDFICDAHEY